jgi:hypothetical protein
MPAGLSSPNIASSILLNVAEFRAIERSERSEEVSPNRLSEGQPSRDTAVRALRQKILGGRSLDLAPNRGSQADLRARRPSQDEKPQDKKALDVRSSGERPGLGHLRRSYDNDTRTYNDTPRDIWRKEPAPPLIVHQEENREIIDVTDDVTPDKKNEPEKVMRGCIPREGGIAAIDRPIPEPFCSN